MEPKRSWWQKIKQHPVASILIALFIVLGVLVLVGGYKLNWAWTGFNGVKVTYKTLYDWLQLLIIPVVLAVAGYVINLTISRGEQEATEQRDITERDLALERQHEATLKEYVDNMSELLLHQKLRDSAEEDEVRKIANIWTSLALSRLDKTRKEDVVAFLNLSKLIEADNIVDLSADSLRGIDISNKSLRGLNFSGAIMIEANFSNTDLIMANLSNSDLTGAFFEGANLDDANLSQALVDVKELEEKAKSLKGAIMPNGSIHP